MPTENRSSNTVQMVSVPASKLKKIHRDLDACQKVIWLRGGFDPAYCKDAQDSLKDIDALLAQPDAQHQGEPVGMLLIDDYFDSREIGEVDVKLDSKVCEQLAANYPGQSLPLYTHADTGEVERLRNELGEAKGKYDRSANRVAALRAQLAERDALLREFLEVVTGGFLDSDHALRVRRDLEALLSASTEPAPVSDGFSPEQMTTQGAGGYRNGIKAAAEVAADYPELAQAIRDLPLPQ